MKKNYAACLKRVLVHEGGYSNHPADPGGATMKGVTQRVYDAYRDRNGLARRSVRNISDPELQAIYRRQYWDAIRGDELPVGIDYATFDAAVNSGVDRAARLLQGALGVGVDGHVGDVTLDAAAAAEPVAVVNGICDRRLAFLRKLRTWSTFGKGWSTRVRDVRAASVAMARGERAARPVALDAEDTGKAVEADTKVTETPEGKSGSEQVTAGASGGVFVTITGYFDKASDFLSKMTGLPDNVAKWVLGAVAALTAATFVGLLARAAWGLLQIYLGKLGAERARAKEAET